MGEIRFVGTGETRGYPYLVCKKKYSERLSLKSSNTEKNGTYLSIDFIYFVLKHYIIF